MQYGPMTEFSDNMHAQKYRAEGESFHEAMVRIASHLADDQAHYDKFLSSLLNMRFMPAGRVQAAIGTQKHVTAFNCFVSEEIEDSFDGIMRALARAGTTMRMGGGIGYNFGTLRPRGDKIKSLDSDASGPVSFMEIFSATCLAICSSGHRRGAQMGILPVSHPDIEEFIDAKQNTHRLTGFNISVGITDDFMECVLAGKKFLLTFNGKTYREIDAIYLWDKIMRSNWDWAEPGVIFLDTINKDNNLRYCEKITATNPCSEQPLPPNGACLLGSFNLTQYLTLRDDNNGHQFAWSYFERDIRAAVRAMDNITDLAKYPLPDQEHEAKSKRRMGLGVTGVANALEIMGMPYGGEAFCLELGNILAFLTNISYETSAELAEEKGVFPLYDAQQYARVPFIKKLNPYAQGLIKDWGLRNSHLTSIAPTGTISLCADNVSSSIEPVFRLEMERDVHLPGGKKTVNVKDYAFATHGIRGRTADQVSIQEHLNVLRVAAEWSDSAVSKTVNITDEIPFEDFKRIYMDCWRDGIKGCSIFNSHGRRMGVIRESTQEAEKAAEACTVPGECETCD